MLPPFSWGEAATNWQFAPVVTAFTALVAAAYLWGALRVRRSHPRRPWPLWRTIPFLLGLLVINLATQSGIGTYDDTLFWDHMIQHLMLIMIAPPLLVLGQPATLLLHASRNPLHTRVKKLLRSRPVQWLTWPVFGVGCGIAALVEISCCSMCWIAVSETEWRSAGVVIVMVPTRVPYPICLLAGHAVFGELRDQRARQNEIEELVDLPNLWVLRLLPRRAPEDGENLDGGQQRAIAVVKIRLAGNGALELKLCAGRRIRD